MVKIKTEIMNTGLPGVLPFNNDGSPVMMQDPCPIAGYNSYSSGSDTNTNELTPPRGMKRKAAAPASAEPPKTTPAAERRRMQNRRAAQVSREKKKKYMNDLQSKVEGLEKDNSSLKKTIARLKEENSSMKNAMQSHTPPHTAFRCKVEAPPSLLCSSPFQGPEPTLSTSFYPRAGGLNGGVQGGSDHLHFPSTKDTVLGFGSPVMPSVPPLLSSSCVENGAFFAFGDTPL